MRVIRKDQTNEKYARSNDDDLRAYIETLFASPPLPFHEFALQFSVQTRVGDIISKSTHRKRRSRLSQPVFPSAASSLVRRRGSLGPTEATARRSKSQSDSLALPIETARRKRPFVEQISRRVRAFYWNLQERPAQKAEELFHRAETSAESENVYVAKPRVPTVRPVNGTTNNDSRASSG